MTEGEWLHCTNPQKMLEFLRGKASDRKMRLFAVACCQRVRDLMVDIRLRHSIEVAERYADELASDQEREVAEEAICEVKSPNESEAAKGHAASAAYEALTAAFVVCASNATTAAFEAMGAVSHSIADRTADSRTNPQGWVDAKDAEGTLHALLLCDLFGPLPFRVVALNRAWLTWQDATILKLAHTIYEDRAFERLPVLADALEEAGCTDADILNHCRQPGEHVRGCWVVDHILGKK